MFSKTYKITRACRVSAIWDVFVNIIYSNTASDVVCSVKTTTYNQNNNIQ